MEKQHEDRSELIELGAASDVTEGLVFGINEPDGLRANTGLVAD